MEIPITIHSDEKGYFDRECPNENCLYTFKINMQDWKEKFLMTKSTAQCAVILIPPINGGHRNNWNLCKKLQQAMLCQ